MSDIGRRLVEEPADEIREQIHRPQLEARGADGFEDMVAVNQAHLAMLAGCRLIDAAAARDLARALIDIGRAGPDTGPVDTRLEDAYFAFETRLAAVAGAGAAGTLHLARSRNDIGATLDRLRARRQALRIEEGLLAVRAECIARAARHAETIVPGHTHLQAAQPITYGFYLAGCESALQRDAERLAQGWDRLNECPMGVAALAGSGFAIDRARTAELLGFGGITRHGLDTVASRDFMLELLSAVSLLGLTWSRLAQDLIVLGSEEFAVVRLPDRVSGTSSIMPQKKNPIALEFLKAQSARSLGALAATLAAVRATPFSVSLDAIREGLADGWRVLDATPGHLGLLRRVIESAEPRRDGLAGRGDRDFSTATDLADGLVRSRGLSFREAHHVVGGAVRLALDLGLDATGIDAALLDRAALGIIGRPLDMADADVRGWLDARAAVARRTTPGGTAPAAVHALLEESGRRLRRTRDAIDARQARLATARASLDDAMRALAAH